MAEPQRPDEAGEEIDEAERHFIEDLVARGEAVPAGANLRRECWGRPQQRNIALR